MSMRTANPQTALQAVTWRRLLISSWPWRSAGYLVTTLPVALAAAAGLAVPAVPWLVLAAQLTSGSYQAGVIVILALLGAALIAVLGPVIATPVAGLERRRLRLADTRPPGPRHRKTAAGGPVAWLRASSSVHAASPQTTSTSSLSRAAAAGVAGPTIDIKASTMSGLSTLMNLL